MKTSQTRSLALFATALVAAFAFASCSTMDDRTSSRKMGNPKTQTTQSSEPKP